MPLTYMRFAHELPVALASKTSHPVRESAYENLSSTFEQDEVVSSIMANSILTTLDLWDGTGFNGAQMVLEAFKTNSTLTTLSLESNSIGDNGAHTLAEALKTNSTLTTLSLGDNSIGFNGAQALSGALKTNSTLT
ncbi:hypothetical protein CPB97_003924, partial [Podila verticillata]